MKIAIIGFGEAGDMFGRGLSPRADVFAFDINITADMEAEAQSANVTLLSDQATVLSGADYIFSLVTADQIEIAAQSAAPHITDKQIYFEMNSAAPDAKRANAQLIPNLVDVAIMAPVYPKQMSVPLLVAHPQAQTHAEVLSALGLNAEAVGDEIGKAAAIKMCRSVMIKGMEALAIECFLTARHYGIDDHVKVSLANSFPDMGWDKDRVDYWFERVSTHGKRRAAEMREVAKTVEAAGTPSKMSQETALAQDLYTNFLSKSLGNLR